MAHFIDTGDGYINLDMVARAKTYVNHNGVMLTAFYGPNGELMGDRSGDCTEILPPVIRAAPGTLATVIYYYEDEAPDTAPSEADLCIEPEPILAWRDFGNYRAPVFRCDILPEGTAFLAAGDKVLELGYGGETLNSIDEARQLVLRRAKRALARKREQPPQRD